MLAPVAELFGPQDQGGVEEGAVAVGVGQGGELGQGVGDLLGEPPLTVNERIDAGLVAAAQAVEHYEIARYGTLKTWAQQLGMKEAVGLLDATLKEEEATDKKLSQVALADVNRKAA